MSPVRSHSPALMQGLADAADVAFVVVAEEEAAGPEALGRDRRRRFREAPALEERDAQPEILKGRLGVEGGTAAEHETQLAAQQRVELAEDVATYVAPCPSLTRLGQAQAALESLAPPLALDAALDGA